MDINFIKYIVSLFSVIVLLSLTSCQKDVFTESAKDDLNLCSAFIGSNPPGAKIYIDGKFSGSVTPDTMKFLSESEHNVTLKINLLKDTTIVLKPSILETKTIFVDYYASPSNFGSINCSSAPSNADIYINNIYKSVKTPSTITYLFPSTYNVKFSYPGYRDNSTSVVVYGGRTSYVSLNLQDTTEWIDYRDLNSNIPSNKVVTVKKDNLNNLWLGTLDQGISKLTNGKFTNYNKYNSDLPYNFVTCIEVDKDNNIWIGTGDGLAKFNGTTWTVYKKATSALPDNYVTAIYCDPNNNIWVGTINGLVKITNNTMTVYTTQNSGIAHNGISTIISDLQGRMWFSVAGGISCLNNGVWSYYSRESHGLSGHEATCLALEPDGSILAAFAENIHSGILGGLMRFDGTDWRVVDVTGIPAGRIQKIYVDKKGNKWISSASGFLVMEPDKTQTLFKSTSFAMFSYDVREILIDDTDFVWIALYGGGILKWKANNF